MLARSRETSTKQIYLVKWVIFIFFLQYKIYKPASVLSS